MNMRGCEEFESSQGGVAEVTDMLPLDRSVNRRQLVETDGKSFRPGEAGRRRRREQKQE